MDMPHSSSPYHRLAGLRPELLMAQGMPRTPEGDIPPVIAGLEILELIGRGGMGAVYRARQIGLNRDVAVKRVAAELARDAVFLDRLEREARTMASLRNPHIVTVHHMEPLDDGGAAIIMEFVEGGNLRDRLDACPEGLPINECIRLFRETAAALTGAHAAGVVHRDLKPENILLGSDGSARITDFGLAVPLDRGVTRLTLTGTTVGTMDYLAPERFQSEDPDARSDLYALGVILYEMLTGRIPRGSFDTPKRIRPEVPNRISMVTMKALRPDPTERFDSVAAFVAAAESKAVRISRRALLATSVAGLATVAGIWKILTPSGNSGNAQVERSAVVREQAWRDVIGTANPEEDSISGSWRAGNDSVFSGDGVCILGFEEKLPQAFDVRVRFVRLSGDHSIAVFFPVNGSIGSVDIDGWGRGLSGVQSIDGRDLRETHGFTFRIENGRRYELFIEVRPEQVTVSIDGRKMGIFNVGSHRLGVVEPWAWNPQDTPVVALAIGSYESPTKFEKVEWRPATIEVKGPD